MSSPIAETVKNIFRKKLIQFHQNISHNHRIEKLSDLIAKEIDNLNIDGSLQCLDIGCGDMLLSEKIKEKLNKPSDWKCIDIHPLPENYKSINKWDKYTQFNGKEVPFKDKQFQIVIICDVLHHDIKNTINLLCESKRVGKYVIVKDHYEYGFFSRTMLQLMDFIGNWAYGIRIPNYYFTKLNFKNFCARANLKTVKEINQIKLYEHSKFFKRLTNSKWQFLAVLTS